MPGRDGSDPEKQQSAAGKELHEAAEEHDKDRVPFEFSQEDEGREKEKEGAHIEPGGGAERGEESRQEDEEPGGENHCDHGGAKRLQNPLEEREGAEAQVEEGEQGDEEAGRKYDADRCDQRPRYAGHLVSDKGGCVHRDGAGGHLGDGDKVCEIIRTEPAVFRDDLLLDERHRGIASAKAEGADL